jgi:hypothetical protein
VVGLASAGSPQPPYIATNNNSQFGFNASTGFVGLGTTIPISKLHINETAGAASQVRIEGHANSGITITTPSQANGAFIGFDGTGGFQINQKTANLPIYLNFNGSIRFLVTSTGAVSFGGVSNYGTSGQILQSNGAGAAPTWISTGSIVASSAGQIQTVAQSSLANYYPTFVNANNTSASGMSVYTTSSFVINPALKEISINGTGRFTSPANGTTGAVVLRSDATSATTYLQWTDNPSQNQYAAIGVTAVNTMTFLLGGAEAMRIAAGGNVGIGTTSPAANLEVSSATGSATPVPTEIRISTKTLASDWSTTLPWGRLGYYSADLSNFGPKLIASIDVISNSTAGGAAGLIFNTVEGSAGALTERMRITNNGGISFGSTGTAYGTAGQILQSNGNVPPTWVNPGAVAGAQGAQGPQGVSGPQGPAGSQGSQGTAGAAGPQGVAGPQGPTGPTGGAGTIGATGLQGLTGSQGIAGSTGPQGPSGAAGGAGTIGSTGPQGPQGVAGTTGAAGALGPQGPQGVSGPQGPAGTGGSGGATGLGYSGLTSTTSVAMGTGSKGFTVNQTQGTNAYIIGNRVRIVSIASTTNYMEGAITGYATNLLTVNVDYVVGSGTIASWNFSITGVLGSTGPSGPAGNIGPAGPAGGAGTIGATGSQGPSGAAGANGGAGTTGAAGPAGAQGNQGPAGPAGPSGVSGPQGPQGPTGNQGVVGPQGPQGNVGATGPQGPTGPQGNQGPTGLQGPAGAAGTNGNNGTNGNQGPQGPTGPGTLTSGTANNVAYYSAASTLTGSTNLTWNGNTLAVNGAITSTGDITAYFSDRRLKTNVTSIPNALTKVMSLNGILYTPNQLAESLGFKGNEHIVGLFADEIEAVLPQAVKPAPFDTDENGNSKSGENYKTIQYEKIVPLLIEAIKELENKVKELEKRVS